MNEQITITTGEQHGLTTGATVYVDIFAGTRMKLFAILWMKIKDFFGTRYIGTVVAINATSFSIGGYRKETFFDRAKNWVKSLLKKKYTARDIWCEVGESVPEAPKEVDLDIINEAVNRISKQHLN